MIVYIKPHSSIPFEFEHMKPVPIEFDSVNDRISFDTFKCPGRYDSDGIQSIWVTAFMVGQWNSVDISFTDDMRIITRGRFFLKAMDSDECTIIGSIELLSYRRIGYSSSYKWVSDITPHQNIDRHQELRLPWDKSELLIKRIIVNNRATIIFWEDGTKTVVKISEDDLHDGKFDVYAGVSYAIAKKLFGTNSAFKKEVDRKVEDKST